MTNYNMQYPYNTCPLCGQRLMGNARMQMVPMIPMMPMAQNGMWENSQNDGCMCEMQSNSGWARPMPNNWQNDNGTNMQWSNNAQWQNGNNYTGTVTPSEYGQNTNAWGSAQNTQIPFPENLEN